MTTATVTEQAEPAAVAARPPAAARRKRRPDNGAGWGFVAPFAVLFLAFLVVPVLIGLYLSFTNQSLTGAGGRIVGFDNYLEAFADADMWRSIGNTLVFTVLSTIPLVVIALVLALLVDAGLPGQWLWRLSFFMPYLLASTVVSIFWIWLYTPQLGLINVLLKPFGVPDMAYLNDPATAMHAVVITTVWWTVGFNFLLYLAALQNIPAQQYEAASLDGAGRLRQLWSITIPQLAPTTVLIVILQVLASLKVFDQVYQMTTGGPGGATRPVIEYIYEAGFTGFRFGYSAAISFLFFALIVIVSLVQFGITSRRGRTA